MGEDKGMRGNRGERRSCITVVGPEAWKHVRPRCCSCLLPLQAEQTQTSCLTFLCLEGLICETEEQNSARLTETCCR